MQVHAAHVIRPRTGAFQIVGQHRRQELPGRPALADVVDQAVVQLLGHVALDQTPPARHYLSSARPFPEKLEDPVYDPDEQVRRVRTSGEIKWKGSILFVSEALVGEAVALRQREDGHWRVRFADVPLLLIDHRTQKIARYGPGRPPSSVANTNPAPKLSGM